MSIYSWGSDEWSALGQWFGAIGTIIAVIVALYLARQTNKPKVKVFAGISVDDNSHKDIEEMNVSITATNVGYIPVTLISSAVRFPRYFRWWYYKTPYYKYPEDLAEGLPFKIDTSDIFKYLLKEIKLARSLHNSGFKNGKIPVRISFLDSLGNKYHVKYKVNMNDWSKLFHYHKTLDSNEKRNEA